jgi:hypothetical protein
LAARVRRHRERRRQMSVPANTRPRRPNPSADRFPSAARAFERPPALSRGPRFGEDIPDFQEAACDPRCPRPFAGCRRRSPTTARGYASCRSSELETCGVQTRHRHLTWRRWQIFVGDKTSSLRRQVHTLCPALTTPLPVVSWRQRSQREPIGTRQPARDNQHETPARDTGTRHRHDRKTSFRRANPRVRYSTRVWLDRACVSRRSRRRGRRLRGPLFAEWHPSPRHLGQNDATPRETPHRAVVPPR